MALFGFDPIITPAICLLIAGAVVYGSAFLFGRIFEHKNKETE